MKEYAALSTETKSAGPSVTMGNKNYMSPIDTVYLDATASLKYELVEDDALNQKIDEIRYVFLHVNGLLQLVSDTAYGANRATTHAEVLPYIYTQIEEVVQATEDDIIELIRMLEVKLKIT